MVAALRRKEGAPGTRHGSGTLSGPDLFWNLSLHTSGVSARDLSCSYAQCLCFNIKRSAKAG